MINRTIDVVDNKADISTLPEEAAHIYVQWLPEGSMLLSEMMRDIRQRPIYDQTYTQYHDNPLYKNSDGAVNEDKIAREAIGKVIADAIVGQSKNPKAKNWWNRLLAWIRSIFTGKDFNSYDIAASDVLGSKISKLDLKAMKEANGRGEVYFQLDKKDQEYIKAIREHATERQQAVIDGVYLNPENRVILNPVNHIYKDTKGNIYTSVTTLLNGEFENDADYIQNRQWGNDFDSILQGIALGKKLSEIEFDHLSADMAADAYVILKDFHRQFTSDGTILLPQVVVYDRDSKVAGTIDLLAIHPDGTRTIIDLKTVRDDSSLTTRHQPGQGSVIAEPLSKRQKHGIQVSTYKKLLALMGYPHAETAIKYLDLQVTGKKTEQVLNGFTDGEYLPLESTSYQQFADTIVPTLWQGRNILEEKGLGNPTHTEEFRQNAVDVEEERQRAADELVKRVQDIYGALTDWKKYLKNIKDDIAFRPGDQTFEKVDRLLAAMEHEADVNQDYSQSYSVFLEAARKQLNDIRKYLTAKNPDGTLKHSDNENFLKVTALAAHYLETFKDLLDYDIPGTPTQVKILHEVRRGLKEVGIAIQAVEDHTATAIITKNTTSDQVRDAAQDLIKKDRDITSGEEWLGSLGGTALIDNTAKEITDAREQIRENTHHYEDRIDTVGNALKAAGGKDYDFMELHDSKGKRTGIAVNNIGTMYRSALRSVEEPLMNDDGSPKQYIPVKDLKTASQEDIDYNINLWYLKNARTIFMEAEHVEYDPDTEAVNVTDGNYHAYTDEFKAARARYMYMNQYGKWNMKTQSKEALEWRNAHMDYTTYTSMVFSKGKPTGQTIEKSDYFPKDHNIKIREIAGDGTLLTDEKYRKLMNPSNDLERAQSAFYRQYMDIMREQIAKLPPSAMYWFEKGFLPTLRGNFLNLVTQKDANIGALIMSQLKDNFSVTSFSGNNTAGKGIPIMFMGSLQDQARLKGLRSSLEALVGQRHTYSSKEAYFKEYDRLKGLIKIEEHKITGEEIHPDLAVGLKAFVHMAENFHVMSAIEDKLLIVKKTLQQMTFTQKGKEVKGKDSRAYRRYNEWMDMVFYNDDSFTKDMAELVVKRLQNLTSSLAIPFNVFGMINNAFVARINNRLDAIGSDFYNHGALNQAILEFNKDHIPGFLRTKAEWQIRNKGTEHYGQKKAGSLYEWLAHEYNMVKHQANTSTGRVDWLNYFGGYSGYDGGEWMVQTQVGNAILRSINITNTKTGEAVSVHDAYTFDPNTGKGKLRQGYTIDSKQKHDITHRIWKTNERIHGNYDPMNKTVLEKYWAGRLAMQFHKWLPANFQIRFQRAHYDENLGGGLNIEGRYITLWNFIKSINRLGAGMEHWNTLTKHQKSNLKKDLADALYVCTLMATGYIVKSIATGIPDDDPYLKKMANWLQYQSDRGVQEVSLFIPGWGLLESYQLIKNPFAVTSTLGKYATLLASMSQYPVNYLTGQDEKNYYDKGVFKGESKVDKQLKDIFPIARELNQLQLLDSRKNFYIP